MFYSYLINKWDLHNDRKLFQRLLHHSYYKQLELLPQFTTSCTFHIFLLQHITRKNSTLRKQATIHYVHYCDSLILTNAQNLTLNPRSPYLNYKLDYLVSYDLTWWPTIPGEKVTHLTWIYGLTWPSFSTVLFIQTLWNMVNFWWQ